MLWESTLPKYTYNKYGVTEHIGFPNDVTTVKLGSFFKKQN